MDSSTEGTLITVIVWVAVVVLLGVLIYAVSLMTEGGWRAILGRPKTSPTKDSEVV